MHINAQHPEAATLKRVADSLQRTFGDAPRVGVVLGSGLGPLVERVQDARSVDFGALGLPQSTVEGHAGKMFVGTLGGVPVVLMSGRVHRYEGHSPQACARGVRSLAVWGVKTVLLTNAAGTCRADWHPGDLAVVSDHINLQGDSPLVGAALGTRFPDMADAYTGTVRQLLRQVGEELGVPLHEGVYAAMLGPAYETPAEIRMLRTLGADLVGMSTVPSVLAAVELGLQVGVVSVVTNYAAGVVDAPVDHGMVTRVAGEASTRLVQVFERVVAGLS